MSKKVAAIICAAGASKRFGGKRKKPLVDVAGRAAFLRSVELFSDRDDVKQILLAISPEDEELVNVKWGANLKFFNVKICFGGEERFDTVSKTLELVKDGETGAAILACPVVATVKEVDKNTIIKTVERAGLYEAQTPQVFKAELLKKAYGNLANLDRSKISDDAQLVEALGEKVFIVETDSSNIKITRPSDIAIAEAVLKSRPKPVPKGPTGPYLEAQW